MAHVLYTFERATWLGNNFLSSNFREWKHTSTVKYSTQTRDLACWFHYTWNSISGYLPECLHLSSGLTLLRLYLDHLSVLKLVTSSSVLLNVRRYETQSRGTHTWTEENSEAFRLCVWFENNITFAVNKKKSIRLEESVRLIDNYVCYDVLVLLCTSIFFLTMSTHFCFEYFHAWT